MYTNFKEFNRTNITNHSAIQWASSTAMRVSFLRKDFILNSCLQGWFVAVSGDINTTHVHNTIHTKIILPVMFITIIKRLTKSILCLLYTVKELLTTPTRSDSREVVFHKFRYLLRCRKIIIMTVMLKYIITNTWSSIRLIRGLMITASDELL